MARLLLFANTTWYLYNFRLGLARAARDAGHDVVLMSPHDEYVERIAPEGFRWCGFSMDRRGLNPVTEVLTVTRAASTYRQLRPDLVHHFTIKPVIYGSMAARIVGIPSIVNSVEGLGYLYTSHRPGVALLRRVLRPAYRLALGGPRSRTIFLNPDDQRRFVEEGIVRKARSQVIPGSGVDVERFRPTPEPAGEPTAVMASRMLWEKGVGDLVEAARILRARSVRGRILLAGLPDPGNPGSIREEDLRSWSESGLVTWLGHVDDVAGLYSMSNLVVLPTKYAEGLPRTLVEAAASGRAMVATDSPGCREIVVDGVTGRLVRPEEPKELAGVIEALWASPEQRAEMGRRARELVLTRYSDERVNGATLELYEELLSISA
jgi:glycosyltransferase involved in cell wall biosynthesis